ncbi:TPA: ATP phosphoribosyltransferase regulatory subunit [Salmonella enterica subsp. enterica serovar Godesberg]|uniref:site-specific DNA-methyltransferase (adenine-specific) n=1 Tax=Salmonella enterica subsp. enterica serovar Abeokuta TaxID=2926665 RepID=A0A8T9IHB8_SALET|nr:BREX-1 system adenine-specific DNA-methyltransferase PglX [Salmonella enterica]EBR8739887.1 ATP phosphoribosyltransferase regulatory subunit [Salmonella enterica subsp. enterica serovar Godesberg]EBU8277416.1 ATP phosphoribosyltransferase regulatory subunit [Salmonella enterica subsp. enterica serovar Senneville]EBW3222030.1 ATP phosphoribosyltransferase regulatory subunit [Salmonella enterica subsp. enterica serovar Ago]EBY3143396.1 ATP phosphoribosyltransferase regulatory subunit [Salmonel
MSLANIHAEWLSLVDISGPFLAIPVLTHTFPQGLEELSSFKRRRLRQAYDEWREALELEDPQLEELHSAWIDEVLSRVLEFDDDDKGDVLKRAKWCGSHLKSVLPDQGVVEYPDLAVVDEQQDNKPLLLIHIYKPNVDLESTAKHEGWITTPADRMVQLCRSLGCRLGLLTNGERWMLVDAPVGAVTSFSSWYARLWSQEPITLQAFVHLLGIRRFFVDESEQLPALFDASLKYQDEVTDALGEQVCRAVEVLIQSLDKADQDRNRELLHDVNESELYEAALTVMMRLVFLLSAEERGLLLLGDECYESNYAISTLRMQLRQEPSEILERRWDAWTRLLATFRAVYSGVEHENLRLPALGSSLFDPDHFPFLEGRTKGSSWKINTAIPLPIDNRTVLLLLDSLQQFQGRTLSYRALDVEQIGYVYEGLLERTVKRTNEVTLQLDVTKKAKSPWVKLAELESATMNGHESLVKLIHERSGITLSRIRRDLCKAVDATLADRLLTASQGNIQLRNRIKPYAHLLRTDPWGYPLVYPERAFLVTTGANRRETGTHYTPKCLTESIVAETLTPLVYIGPAEGRPRENWQLKTPSEILDLKICDPAMGSGAFLVQTCRWMADRLVEAWSQAEESGNTLSVDGNELEYLGTNELLPLDMDARIIIARRLIAEGCLYGVDLNPLAVELAKLSIWLVTLSKDRPFGFLDHNLRCGDSLLGIHQLEQLTQLSMTPSSQKKSQLFGQFIESTIRETIGSRHRLRKMPTRDIHDIDAISQLNAEVHRKLKLPEQIANAFIEEVLASNGNISLQVKTLESLAIKIEQSINDVREEKTLMYRKSIITLPSDLSTDKFPLRPFHWPLEFPEVFLCEKNGFDGIVGNPPFLGGKRISTIMGATYNSYLAYMHLGTSKNTDLVAHFFRRAFDILRKGGTFGLLATNTIAEGDTRQGGLEWLLKNGANIYAAWPDEPWLGTAAVITSRVHIYKGQWCASRNLLGCTVSNISAYLTSHVDWSLKRLKANEGKAFIGSFLNGIGFVLDNSEAQDLINDDPKYRDVIYQYLNGQDLNTHPEQKSSRWVINFWDWPEERAQQYEKAMEIVLNKVKPHRDQINIAKKKVREKWWLYEASAKELYHTIGYGHYFEKHPHGWEHGDSHVPRVLALTRVSKTLAFSFVSAEQIFSEQTVIFPFARDSDFSLLQSNIHAVFAWQHSSRMKSDLRYGPSDALETFPFPKGYHEMPAIIQGNLGECFHRKRSEIMKDDQIGLTKFYNRFHDEISKDIRINELREIQREMDIAVACAYGWDDLDLEHGFHHVPYLPERDRIRFTISEAARVEVLHRLSELNRQRYQEEVAANMHGRTVKSKVSNISRKKNS